MKGFLLLAAVFFLTALATDSWAAEDILRAARSGDYCAVEAVVKEHPEKVFISDENGVTPLHNAAFGGHRDIAEILILTGADVEARDSEGDTPMHVAAFGGHISVVELLLGKGANIEAKDTAGWTPLISASFGGCRDMVVFLLDKGADMKARDNRGNTAAFWAVKGGSKEISELLRQRAETK